MRVGTRVRVLRNRVGMMPQLDTDVGRDVASIPRRWYMPPHTLGVRVRVRTRVKVSVSASVKACSITCMECVCVYVCVRCGGMYVCMYVCVYVVDG